MADVRKTVRVQLDADEIKMALKKSKYFETVEIPSTAASGTKQKFKLVATLKKAAGQ